VTERQKNVILFDALIKVAVAEAFEAELDALPQESELLDYAPSPDFDRRIGSLIRRSYGRIRTRRALKTTGKIAACLCILLTVTSVVLLSVGATRTAILNAVIEWTDKYTAFQFQATSDQPWRRPTYVPAGYVEKKADIKSAMAQFVYENGAGDMILLNEMKADGTTMAIDNERHKYSEVQLNGVKAYLFTGETQEDGNILLWEARGTMFTLQTMLDKNELMRIAESIG
jgi:hypothetical protein